MQPSQGWEVRESGPPDAAATVLCLPGALCTGVFYDDLAAEPSLADIRLVAAALPGQGGAPAVGDLGVESDAELMSELARDRGCAVVVGHSLGANVALEMAASGGFTGPVVLLAPSLSRQDESLFPRVLDRLGTVLGTLPFRVALRIIGPALKDSLPPHRRAELVAELHKNDPHDVRRSLRPYFAYLDRYGSLAGRLCEAGVPAWFVLGENDDIKISAEERRRLEECPHVTLVQIAGAGHFTANQEPAQIAQLLLEALAAGAAPGPPTP